MWRHSGQPVVHDAAGENWVLGTGAAQRRAALESLEAPDFTLPDLDGRPHRLSDLRGRRVLLATWASW
jgi:cytochrome oxidase Cu insertion factor (SCO1/SenC/PrrC family)